MGRDESVSRSSAAMPSTVSGRAPSASTSSGSSSVCGCGADAYIHAMPRATGNEPLANGAGCSGQEYVHRNGSLEKRLLIVAGTQDRSPGDLLGRGFVG